MKNITGNREIRSYIVNDDLSSRRRKHIAECAKHVFYENGYHETSMRELAKACGMTVGAMYNYIGSKDDILHLIIRELDHSQLIFEPFYKSLGEISHTETLTACMIRFFQNIDERQDILLFAIREIRNYSKEDRSLLLSATDYIVSFFERLLTDGCKDGEFEIDNPRLVAHNIYIMAQSWARERWYLKKQFTVEEYAEKQAAFILKAIRRD